jgi:hypothetical protein
MLHNAMFAIIDQNVAEQALEVCVCVCVCACVRACVCTPHM